MPWVNSEQEEDRDLFVSYARADNRGGWVEEFMRALAEEYRGLTGARPVFVNRGRHGPSTPPRWKNPEMSLIG